MKRHRQHSHRMCLCMTSVSVSQSKYNKIWKCERLASTSGPFERSPLMSYHFRNNSWQRIIIENWVILNNLVKNKSKVANCAACINDSGFFASVALRTVHILKIFLCLYELGLTLLMWWRLGAALVKGPSVPHLTGWTRFLWKRWRDPGRWPEVHKKQHLELSGSTHERCILFLWHSEGVDISEDTKRVSICFWTQ